MSFDYTGSNTGVFTRLGALIAASNVHLVNANTNLPAEVSDVYDLYQAAGATANGLYVDMIQGWLSFYQQLQGAEIGARQTIAGYMQNTLLDQDTVITRLPGPPAANIQAVLLALFVQMGTDGKTVNRSAVTSGAVTPGSSNTGNGTVLLTKTLDGYNPPIISAVACLGYAGLLSELAVPSETMTFLCTADSQRDGAQQGAERFSWSGGVAQQSLDFRPEGSGPGPGLAVIGSRSLVADGSFQQWGAANTPVLWTIGGGIAGTNIFQELVNVYNSTSALKFLGDGSTTPIYVYQAISTSQLKSRRMYSVSVRIKASGVGTGGSALVIEFTGTGYSAASSEKIAIAAGSFPTAWTLYNFFIVLPAIIPSNWALNIVGNSLASGLAVYFDSLCMAEVTYHGGVGAVVVPGSTPFVDGDVFTAAISNNDAGLWQQAFRQYYQFQLPSSAASPNILDALITL